MTSTSLSIEPFQLPPSGPTGMPGVGQADPIEQIADADRADWVLMRLVLCSATATLVLGLALSLQPF